ncbi:hypothetical protein GCM10009837_43100 [Streptomyces durmitorensis]|uniref:CN hydrolase domain-containing protein n=1 Tax=Streptomyces durmitorensis TaxID=319947 RepID=A0ABY4Q3N5_9ACTN|nr:hypothetical protein [Streptomyces durmitorensis]UQT60677.1 hypothetical protein M4V62_39515 [Streptomyces durmitorensis]
MNKEPRDPDHSVDEIELPVDPADLFVVLYDALPNWPFSGRTANKWFGDIGVKQRAELVCKDVRRDGRADIDLVRDLIRQYGDQGMFAVLMGLDRAFENAGIYPGTTGEKTMCWLARRYQNTNSLNSNTDRTGLLLPRYTRPGKVTAEHTGKPDFFSVHRVTPAAREGIWHSGILHLEPRGCPRGQAISIGAAPVLESYLDLKFEFPDGEDIGLYRIAPDDGRLRPRIERVFQNLENSGAQIGVLPECTLSNDLLKHWDTLLHSDPSEASRLQWILPGTGPIGPTEPDTAPPNRAVLFDRETAQVLLWQDKMAGFTLGEGQAEDWQLPDRPKHEPAAEYISKGDQVAVLETFLGRIAILICEDIKQNAAWLGKCQAFGVSHIFVPLFASPISQRVKRWTLEAAEHCVDQLGAWVVLSNSLAVEEGMRTRPDFVADGAYNCVVVGPSLPRPTKHAKAPAQFCRSATVEETARVVCDEHGAPPAYDPDDPAPLPKIRCGPEA